MTKNQINAIAFVTSAIVTAGFTIRNIRRINRKYAIECQMIEENSILDIQAIMTASDLISARIERGEIRSLEDLRDAVNTEIAFQKIAVREED